MTAGYALLYHDDRPADRHQVAELLAECLAQPVANVLQAISLHWGILGEGLTESLAQRCARALDAAGLPVDVVADDQLFALPERIELRKAAFHPGGLTYTMTRQTHCTAWEHFVFLDVVRLPTGKLEKHTDRHVEITSAGEFGGARIVEDHVMRLSNDFPLHLDAIAREPWTWLRMSLDRFFYGSTGLPVHPTRKVNFYALALELAKRAQHAATGPGYRTIAGEGSLHTQEVLSEEAWRQRLRWRLSQMENGLR